MTNGGCLSEEFVLHPTISEFVVEEVRTEKLFNEMFGEELQKICAKENENKK